MNIRKSIDGKQPFFILREREKKIKKILSDEKKGKNKKINDK